MADIKRVALIVCIIKFQPEISRRQGGNYGDYQEDIDNQAHGKEGDLLYPFLAEIFINNIGSNKDYWPYYRPGRQIKIKHEVTE